MKSIYTYDEAKKAAIRQMHRYMRGHLRATEKFQYTGDIWHKYRAMYLRDKAEQLASSWNVRITNYSMYKLEVRELGV